MLCETCETVCGIWQVNLSHHLVALLSSPVLHLSSHISLTFAISFNLNVQLKMWYERILPFHNNLNLMLIGSDICYDILNSPKLRKTKLDLTSPDICLSFTQVWNVQKRKNENWCYLCVMINSTRQCVNIGTVFERKCWNKTICLSFPFYFATLDQSVWDMFEMGSAPMLATGH